MPRTKRSETAPLTSPAPMTPHETFDTRMDAFSKAHDEDVSPLSGIPDFIRV